MKLLIEIDDKHRSNIKKKFNSKDTIDGIFDYLKKVEKASVEIIPDNASNGDVIKALFPNGVEIKDYDEEVGYDILITDEYTFCSWFDYLWWNAPYKGGE